MLLAPEFWVGVAFFIFVGIVVKMGGWKAAIAGLDTRSEKIRAELEDAKQLRLEAQRVLADYQKKRQQAEAEAEIVRAARAEAERLAQDTQAKLADFVARRTRMAEQKIAQAEAQATADVRAAAADAAVTAAEKILRNAVKTGEGDALLEQGLSDVRARLN